MNNQKITVLVPCYNSSKFLRRALDSIIMQRGVDLFVIVSDDASEEDLTSIVNSYQTAHTIIYRQNEINVGLVQHYKMLVDMVETAFFAILEPDDYWTDEHKLEKQLDIIGNSVLCYTDYIIKSQNGIKKSRKLKDITREQIFAGMSPGPLTFLVRTSSARDVLRMIKDSYVTFDLPLLLNLRKNGDFSYLDECTSCYNIHGASVSNSNDRSKQIDFQRGIIYILWTNIISLKDVVFFLERVLKYWYFKYV